MKSLKIWSLIALFAIALVGCGNDEDNGGDNSIVQTDIYGMWHLNKVSNVAPEFDVYIEFKKDGKFKLYQQVWTLTYELYTGTFTAENGVINGKYSDGSAWIASYEFSVANSKLTLVNTNNSEEVNIYTACRIPAEVIEEATSSTRSEGVVPFL